MGHFSGSSEMHPEDLRLLTGGFAGSIRADERRAAPRRCVSEPCTVVAFNGSEFVRAKGAVRDVSDGGMRVTTSLKAQRGSNLKVYLRLGTVVGDVRHCTNNGDGTFDVGIAVEAGHGIVRRL